MPLSATASRCFTAALLLFYCCVTAAVFWRYLDAFECYRLRFFLAALLLLYCCCFLEVSRCLRVLMPPVFPHLFYCCFVGALLLLYCCSAAALLLLYCCLSFTALEWCRRCQALLLRSSKAALLLLYCCFTADLLLLYCCFTAALLLRDRARGA